MNAIEKNMLMLIRLKMYNLTYRSPLGITKIVKQDAYFKRAWGIAEINANKIWNNNWNHYWYLQEILTNRVYMWF